MNQIKKILGGVLVIKVVVAFSLTFGYGDDALVLPKGIFRVGVDGNFYMPIHKRFNPDGKVEDLAVDFNGALNSNVFPALAPLDPFVPGLPSVGESRAEFKYEVQTLESVLQYGVTDSLTVGVTMPYTWFRNKVKASIDSGPGSSANVGKNPFFACGAPFCPLFVPGTSRITTEDVQQLLGKGLDVNGDGVIDVPGFKFKRFETYKHDGLMDVDATLRYQYFKSANSRLALGGGVRFPTGKVDDPNNLTDYAFGSGAYALLFRLNNDFVITNLWKANPDPNASAERSVGVTEPGDLVLNGTFRYDVLLPDKQTKRVSDDVNQPLTRNKEVVKRNLGDVFEYEASARLGLAKGLTVSGLYRYSFKLQDQVSGKLGFIYRSLEEETQAKSHIYIFGLSYSTVPLFLEKKFPVPLSASLSYRNRFAGSNNVLRSQYIGIALNAFFCEERAVTYPGRAGKRAAVFHQEHETKVC